MFESRFTILSYLITVNKTEDNSYHFRLEDDCQAYTGLVAVAEFTDFDDAEVFEEYVDLIARPKGMAITRPNHATFELKMPVFGRRDQFAVIMLRRDELTKESEILTKIRRIEKTIMPKERGHWFMSIQDGVVRVDTTISFEIFKHWTLGHLKEAVGEVELKELTVQSIDATRQWKTFFKEIMEHVPSKTVHWILPYLADQGVVITNMDVGHPDVYNACVAEGAWICSYHKQWVDPMQGRGSTSRNTRLTITFETGPYVMEKYWWEKPYTSDYDPMVRSFHVCPYSHALMVRLKKKGLE